MRNPGTQIPTSPSVDLMLSSCTTSRWAAWDTMGSEEREMMWSHTPDSVLHWGQREKEKWEKFQNCTYLDQERHRKGFLAEAADGLQYADDFVACSPCRFINTICTETECCQDAPYYNIIMWPGWSHKHNSLWSCCLLWIDPSNLDCPSICCWWLISEGVPSVANGNSLSLSLSLSLCH